MRSSVICHLAVIHDELRDVMEKDERLDKEFIQAVYYDVDLKKLQSSGGNVPKNEGKTEIATKKSSSPPPKKQTPGPAKLPRSEQTSVTNKPGPKSKTKPGPKSKTRTKVIKLDDSMEENDGIPDLDLFVSDD